MFEKIENPCGGCTVDTDYFHNRVHYCYGCQTKRAYQIKIETQAKTAWEIVEWLTELVTGDDGMASSEATMIVNCLEQQLKEAGIERP